MNLRTLCLSLVIGKSPLGSRFYIGYFMMNDILNFVIRERFERAAFVSFFSRDSGGPSGPSSAMPELNVCEQKSSPWIHTSKLYCKI